MERHGSMVNIHKYIWYYFREKIGSNDIPFVVFLLKIARDKRSILRGKFLSS